MKKQIIATAVVTKTKSVLVLLDPKTMKGGIYLPGTEKVDLDSVAVEGVEMVSLNEAHLKAYKKYSRFITFGRSDQTYLVLQVLN